MITIDDLIMLVTAVLLLFIDWLAFHDFLEAHTIRDWLMLVATGPVFIQFGSAVWKEKVRGR
jgi:hypothetical protein